MWPRFKLTPYEERHGATKYFDPSRGARGVLRRFYSGSLTTSQTERQPVFSFGIARRSRVFGLTASGDLGQFRVQLSDSAGENYFATPVNLAVLLGGYVEVPPSALGTGANTGPTGGFPSPDPIDAASELIYGNYQGNPHSQYPFIFEPNIVLRSNQTVGIVGFPMSEYEGYTYRVDFTLHVWEFPTWIEAKP